MDEIGYGNSYGNSHKEYRRICKLLFRMMRALTIEMPILNRSTTSSRISAVRSSHLRIRPRVGASNKKKNTELLEIRKIVPKKI